MNMYDSVDNCNIFRKSENGKEKKKKKKKL